MNGKLGANFDKFIGGIQKVHKHQKKKIAELSTPVANILKKNIPAFTKKIEKKDQNWVDFNSKLVKIDRNITRLKNNELKGAAYVALLRTISIKPENDALSLTKLIEKAGSRFGLGQQNTLISVCELTIDIVATLLKGIEEISNITPKDRNKMEKVKQTQEVQPFVLIFLDELQTLSADLTKSNLADALTNVLKLAINKVEKDKGNPKNGSFQPPNIDEMIAEFDNDDDTVLMSLEKDVDDARKKLDQDATKLETEVDNSLHNLQQMVDKVALDSDSEDDVTSNETDSDGNSSL